MDTQLVLDLNKLISKLRHLEAKAKDYLKESNWVYKLLVWIYQNKDSLNESKDILETKYINKDRHIDKDIVLSYNADEKAFNIAIKESNVYATPFALHRSISFTESLGFLIHLDGIEGMLSEMKLVEEFPVPEIDFAEAVIHTAKCSPWLATLLPAGILRSKFMFMVYNAAINYAIDKFLSNILSKHTEEEKREIIANTQPFSFNVYFFNSEKEHESHMPVHFITVSHDSDSKYIKIGDVKLSYCKDEYGDIKRHCNVTHECNF